MYLSNVFGQINPGAGVFQGQFTVHMQGLGFKLSIFHGSLEVPLFLH